MTKLFKTSERSPLTLRSPAGGWNVHDLWFKVCRQGAQCDVCVERHVGPEVDTEVVHVCGGEEVSRGGEGETRHGRINEETVNQSEGRCTWAGLVAGQWA